MIHLPKPDRFDQVSGAPAVAQIAKHHKERNHSLRHRMGVRDRHLGISTEENLNDRKWNATRNSMGFVFSIHKTAEVPSTPPL